SLWRRRGRGRRDQPTAPMAATARSASRMRMTHNNNAGEVGEHEVGRILPIPRHGAPAALLRVRLPRACPPGSGAVFARPPHHERNKEVFMIAFAKRETRVLFGAAVLAAACADQPAGLAPPPIPQHAVAYDPADEGAVYDPPRGGGDSVSAGGTYTYTWRVVPESGPLPGEPSSKVWLYHSHVTPDVEVYRGLVGTIVVTDPAYARDDGSPDDVNREFTTLWLIFHENTEGTPDSLEEANLKHSINGYFFGNLPGLR